MSGLTEDEREAIYRADDHHLCGCDADVIEQAFAEDCCCDGLLDTFATVERIIAARTRAVEQERDEWIARFNAEYPERVERLIAEWKARAVAAEQRVTELEAAVLALCERADAIRGSHNNGDLTTMQVRALVSDPTVLDRVRREAVEAALAPIEALVDVTLDWYASDKPLISADQLRQALAAARDAAGRSGGVTCNHGANYRDGEEWHCLECSHVWPVASDPLGLGGPERKEDDAR